MPETVLLSTAYFAPVSYYVHLLHYKNIYIEQYENYSKQTYRNRCIILSANGPLALSIPVLKTESLKNQTRDVEIDYNNRWKAMHWRAIESAYRSSPFFMYYADEIFECFQLQENKLLNYNLQLQKCILNQLGINLSYSLTSEYKKLEIPFIDGTDSFSPKQSKEKFPLQIRFVPYYQVFENKYRFVPDLSILDLLFNLGPATEDYLKKCTK